MIDAECQIDEESKLLKTVEELVSLNNNIFQKISDDLFMSIPLPDSYTSKPPQKVQENKENSNEKPNQEIKLQEDQMGISENSPHEDNFEGEPILSEGEYGDESISQKDIQTGGTMLSKEIACPQEETRKPEKLPLDELRDLISFLRTFQKTEENENDFPEIQGKTQEELMDLINQLKPCDENRSIPVDQWCKYLLDAYKSALGIHVVALALYSENTKLKGDNIPAMIENLKKKKFGEIFKNDKELIEQLSEGNDFSNDTFQKSLEKLCTVINSYKKVVDSGIETERKHKESLIESDQQTEMEIYDKEAQENIMDPKVEAKLKENDEKILRGELMTKFQSEKLKDQDYKISDYQRLFKKIKRILTREPPISKISLLDSIIPGVSLLKLLL